MTSTPTPIHLRSPASVTRAAIRALAAIAIVMPALIAACAVRDPAGARGAAPPRPPTSAPLAPSPSAAPQPPPPAPPAPAPTVASASSSAAPGPPPPSFPPQPFQKPLPPPDSPAWADAVAVRAANLSPAQCRAELRRRKLPFQRVGGNTRGVATPVRITGPIRGVRFRGPGPRSVHGILDCRLALVLDDVAAVLARHDVVDVAFDNTYRRGARLPGKRKPSQHAHAMAMDIRGFTLRDGRFLGAEDTWKGTRGAPACGPGAAPTDPTDGALRLRNIVCDIARAGLFHHILTPNFDAAHRNHFHFDIKRGADRVAIR